MSTRIEELTPSERKEWREKEDPGRRFFARAVSICYAYRHPDENALFLDRIEALVERMAKAGSTWLEGWSGNVASDIQDILKLEARAAKEVALGVIAFKERPPNIIKTVFRGYCKKDPVLMQTLMRMFREIEEEGSPA